MTKKKYIIISPDYDELYQDIEGCTYNGFGDEIYIDDRSIDGLCFSFVVPGIQEWLRHYENATDFADTTTHPDFDWCGWHKEGLLFAKAIREKLPKCYDLIYRPPFEDNSGLVNEMIIDESIDDVINALNGQSNNVPAECAIKDNVVITAKPKPDALELHFAVNRLTTEIAVSSKHLTGLSNWLVRIANNDSDVAYFGLIPNKTLCFFPQRIGRLVEMGQFWVIDNLTDKPVFQVYVNTREFVKVFYLTVLTKLGFGIYQNINGKLEEEARQAVWRPYNAFKSLEIESYIYSGRCKIGNKAPIINETFVMFPDYGGTIFWDTMGVGSGDATMLYSDFGELKLAIPCLDKWSEYYDNPDNNISYEDYWNIGWELAKQIRKHLPANIDLFYMCYDPKEPDKIVSYRCDLPRLIVPR